MVFTQVFHYTQTSSTTFTNIRAKIKHLQPNENISTVSTKQNIGAIR